MIIIFNGIEVSVEIINYISVVVTKSVWKIKPKIMTNLTS